MQIASLNVICAICYSCLLLSSIEAFVIAQKIEMEVSSGASSAVAETTAAAGDDDVQNSTSAEATKCIPCSTMDPSFLLSDDVVKERLQESHKLRLWDLSSDGKSISRSFVSRDFQAALDAINAMGEIAETQSHHPDFHLTNYRNVQIDIWTHKLGGVTDNDLTLAELFDDVQIQYSPKWLKEHPYANPTSGEQQN